MEGPPIDRVRLGARLWLDLAMSTLKLDAVAARAKFWGRLTAYERVSSPASGWNRRVALANRASTRRSSGGESTDFL